MWMPSNAFWGEDIYYMAVPHNPHFAEALAYGFQVCFEFPKKKSFTDL